MKRSIAILIVFVLFLSLSSQLFAEDNATKKLGRGVANVVTCPFELPKSMGETNEESGIFAGMTWGLFEGLVGTVKRAVVGVYEVATFPVPLPSQYKPILKDPEFFLESEQTRTNKLGTY